MTDKAIFFSYVSQFVRLVWDFLGSAYVPVIGITFRSVLVGSLLFFALIKFLRSVVGIDTSDITIPTRAPRSSSSALIKKE